MYYACDEHVELALDVVIDECEKAPTLKKLSENEQISTTCHFCKRGATYEILA